MNITNYLYNKKNVRKECHIKILFNIISIDIYDKISFEIYFFGIILFSYLNIKLKDEKIQNIKMFSRLSSKKQVRQILFDELIEKTNCEFKNIVYLRCASGEVYMFSLFLENFMKENKLTFEDTCFVGWKKLFGDLLLMYYPNLNFKCIPLDGDANLYSIENYKYKYKNINFFMIFAKNFMYKYNYDLKNGIKRDHAFKELLKAVELKDSKINNHNITFPIDIEKNVLKKIKSYKINLDNFIFFIPEAVSSANIDTSIWNKLENRLKEQGIDIFYNTKELNLIETLWLAKKAKSIIGLSCGLLEITLQLQIPTYVIYTGIVWSGVPANKIAFAYDKKLFPYADKNKIYEYIMDDYSPEDLVNKIVDDINKKELKNENYSTNTCKI